MSSSTSPLSNTKTAELVTSATSLLNTGVSAYASYQSSVIQSNFMKLQARQHELQANQERLKGIQQSNTLREQLLNNLSSATAMFSSSGVGVGSRSAQALAARNISVSRRDIGQVQSNAELRALSAESSAISQRYGAKSERITGRSRVAQQLFGETTQGSIGSLLSGFSSKKKKVVKEDG